jgi:hypothetical protein
VQVAYLRRELAGKFNIRSVALLEDDWTSLLKTSRERFIVPDQEDDETIFAELEKDGGGGDKASKSVGDNIKQRIVTGSPPQVGVPLPC